VRLPKGFLAPGIRAGIRRSGRPRTDRCAGRCESGRCLHEDRFQAAPVTLSKNALKKTGGKLKAVVGQCTDAPTRHRQSRLRRGKRDRSRCCRMWLQREKFRRVDRRHRRRPPRSETFARSLPDAVTRLSLGGIDAFSHAILTTTLVRKSRKRPSPSAASVDASSAWQGAGIFIPHGHDAGFV